MKNIKRIHLEDEDGKQVSFEVDNATFTEEAGLLVKYRMGQYAPIAHERNGQTRVLIKGWLGCRDYDSFEPSTDLTI